MMRFQMFNKPVKINHFQTIAKTKSMKGNTQSSIIKMKANTSKAKIKKTINSLNNKNMMILMKNSKIESKALKKKTVMMKHLKKVANIITTN